MRGLFFAILLAAISNVATAEPVAVEFVAATALSASGSTTAIIQFGGTYMFDAAGGTLTQAGGETYLEWWAVPTPGGRLFDHRWTGLEFDLVGGSITAAEFECIEGTFGFSVGASICGSTNAGTNQIGETTVDYSTIPGTRVVGGDDFSIGPQQQLTDFASTIASWDGSSLVIQTTDWDPVAGTGYVLQFAQVPMPAAVYLFGSALGLLGWARRRHA